MVFSGRGIKIKFKYFILIISTILIVNILSINVSSGTKDSEYIVKVGVYEYEPYISVDSNGSVSGYYHDLLNLIRKKYDFKYEYVVCDFSEGVEKLQNGDIDIMLGLTIYEKNEKIIFNKYSTNEELFGIFSKEHIDLDKLKQFDEVRLGLVEGDYNAQWVLKFLKSNDIKIITVYDKNYKKLEKLLNKDEIDLMVANASKQSKYEKIYEFIGNQIYIGGNKNSKVILDNIDSVIKEYQSQENNPIENLTDKYFNEDYNKNLIKILIFTFIVIISSSLVIIMIIIPKIKKKIIKNKIRFRMCNNRYLLQYQPIYNPRDKSIVGFEGLLRLLDAENKLIPPFKFIPEIEENEMLFDISLWILKKAIKDYDKIKNYKCIEDKDFYISINISLHEIENDIFVKKATKILSKFNLEKGMICLEIIERVKIHDLNKINKNINILKSAGFKIAIDDFGIEYSNLDVLHKLDVDIIKVDKNFIDGIGKDAIRHEVVLFISKIANSANKAVVLEGVEEAEQDAVIKDIENSLLYVQGYYYNKPMYIEDIEKL